MRKTEIIRYRNVNRAFKILLNSLKQGYNENISFSKEDIELFKDSNNLFEVLNSFMAIHVAKGHEQELSKELESELLFRLIKNFNITMKPESNKKDTFAERVKQIRNCILHRNVKYLLFSDSVNLENKYIKGDVSFRNYMISLYELFSVDEPYTSGKGTCFKKILPEKRKMKTEEDIEEFLKGVKFLKYKTPDSIVDVNRNQRKGINKTEFDDMLEYCLFLLNKRIHIEAPSKLEKKIKEFIDACKDKAETSYPRESFKKGCEELKRTIKMYAFDNKLKKEFMNRISFIGKDTFFALSEDEQTEFLSSVFIDQILSKERNDNDYYAYAYIVLIADYLKNQRESGNVSVEDLINNTIDIQKNVFGMNYKSGIYHFKIEKFLMFECIALANMQFSLATFKELFDKDLKKDKEQKGQDDILIDLDDINIPEGIKYKCYVERKSFENELEKKIKGQNNELDVQKSVISKGFYFNTKYRRALNPKNPKINDVKNSLFDNKERIQEAFERLKLISKRTGKLKVKKDLLNKSKGKFIEITNDNKEFFRSMRDALSHNWITIDRTNAYKTGDLNDLSFTFKDYEMKEKKINGKMQKVRGKQIFEATMSMRDFFELTSNIESALEQNHDKDKISLVDIAKDALLSDLNISLADICEELIPTERSK